MNASTQAMSPSLARHIGVAVLIGATLSFLAYWNARPLVQLTLPILAAAIDWLEPNFVALLSVENGGFVEKLSMTPFSLGITILGPQSAIPAHSHLPAVHSSVGHCVIPVVILLTAASAWPVSNRKEWFTRAVLAIAFALPVYLVIVSVHLAANLEMDILTAMRRLNTPVRQTFLIDLELFLETGGRWLLPLAIAAVCIALGKRIAHQSAPDM